MLWNGLVQPPKLLRRAPSHEPLAVMELAMQLPRKCLADRNLAGSGSIFGRRKHEMLYLARPDEFLYGACAILDGHVRINTVLVQRVDDIGLQAPEHAVNRRPDVIRTAVENLLLAVVAQGESELGRDDHLIANGSQRLADNLLVEIRPVDLSDIEESDAAVESCANQLHGLCSISGRAVTVAQSHAREASCRNFPAPDRRAVASS